MTRHLVASLFLFLMAFGEIGAAVAQPAAPPAQSAPVSRNQTTAPPASVASQNSFYAWVAAKQSDYNRRLAATVREIRTGDPWLATFLLMSLSFAYGILHAAGPGHGKAVITSYALANERTVRRGIALSFLAAIFQALSALIVVAVLMLVFQASGIAWKAVEGWLETISWALVAMLGAWLLWGQVSGLLARRAMAAAHADVHGHHHHDHAHDGHAHHSHAHAHHGHHHADHGHDHGHGASGCEVCDHVHMPDPRQLEGEWSWTRALALAAAIGVRPCTGAILVLGFAASQGLVWAGVLATFAMALGTAITVSTLAAIAVGSRELAARYGSGGSAWGRQVRTAAGICGSLAVLVLGIAFFIGSLGPGNAL